MNLQKQFKKIPYFSLIPSIAKKKNSDVWLVGGFLRDLCLGRVKEFHDFDFCVERDVYAVACEFAKKTSSKIIILDKEQESYRVIVKKKDKVFTPLEKATVSPVRDKSINESRGRSSLTGFTYDFTRMRGNNLYEDLTLRDFSINTLAVNLNDSKYTMIDPFGGRADLKKKLIRFIKEEVLFQDPLRILRGFSFMANYGFRISDLTRKAMIKYKVFLKNVSGERINEELFKIFSADKSYPAIKKLSELKILDEVIPDLSFARGVFQGGYHHLDVWEHSLETLRKFEEIWRRKLSKNIEIYNYFYEELAQSRKRIQLIKLACLLHDIGKPVAKKQVKKKTIFHAHEKIGRDLAGNFAENLRLSFREKEILKKLIFWHLRPGYLADQAAPSKKAIYRFFRDTQEDGIAVIVLSLSDWRATRGPLTDTKKRKKHEKVMLSLIDNYLRESVKKPLPKLIDGYDLMREFNLSPSPLIGKVLRKVREEQTLGRVSAKAQAYKIAKKMIK